MTLCFATWHRGRKKLRVANAGQEQPFLFHNGKCERIMLEGFPLGMLEESVYDQRSYILNEGDVVVFHSDGIGDSQNPALDFFGHERLAEIITAHHLQNADTIADHILEAVDGFTGGAHPFDDRTLVVLKVK
jgi:sigma-B regulation protein RsbU (phosphoserine phosphatase)